MTGTAFDPGNSHCCLRFNIDDYLEIALLQNLIDRVGVDRAGGYYLVDNPIGIVHVIIALETDEEQTSEETPEGRVDEETLGFCSCDVVTNPTWFPIPTQDP